jgi:hypothetical protein
MPGAELRAWMEIAYFGSGVLLVLVAVAGLRQLSLAKRSLQAARDQLHLAAESLTTAKDEIRIRSEREAVSLAAQRCEKFAEELVPRHYEHVANIQKEGVTIYRWQMRDGQFLWNSFEQEAGARKWITTVQQNEAASKSFMALLNDLEAFAIYFATGAADEKVAYPVVGALFCSWLEAFAPYLASIRADTPKGIVSGAFENAVALYGIWSGRTRKRQLEADANRINLELSGIRIPEIRPIGTDRGA